MPSLTITTRRTKSGPRHVVRYRLGGRAYPLVHGGSFRTLKEAKSRRDLIAGELAAGRNPAELLRAMLEAPKPVRTARTLADEFLASRLDLADGTRRTYRFGLEFFLSRFGERQLETIAWQELGAWLAEPHEVSVDTLAAYFAPVKMLFDFAEVVPNPARNRNVRLPIDESGVDVASLPPTAEHFEQLLAALRPRVRLAVALMEQAAFRVSEAMGLAWGDIDWQAGRVLVRAETTKGRRGRRRHRWVPLADWLLEAVAVSCPPDDRAPARRLLLGLDDHAVRKAMTRACQKAGLPHYSPHDLRHRRATLWHYAGEPDRQIAEWGGWKRVSTMQDIYTHAGRLGEVPVERYQALLRAPGVVPVWSEVSEIGANPPS